MICLPRIPQEKDLATEFLSFDFGLFRGVLFNISLTHLDGTQIPIFESPSKCVQKCIFILLTKYFPQLSMFLRSVRVSKGKILLLIFLAY